MKKILINIPKGLNQLKEDFPQAEVIIAADQAELSRHLPEAEVLVSFAFDEDILDQGKQLKYIASLFAGVDKLPLERVKQRGIILTTGRGVHVIQMSEYAIMMMVLHARGLDKLLDQQRQAVWAGAEVNPQDQIHGKKLGIVGLGAIGQEIAKKASFMGMEVVGVRRTAQATEHVSQVYSLDGLKEVFASCDYIINLLPHTPQTHRLIDKTYLDVLKPEACVINMGRGDTVNEDDLYQALVDKKFKRYITDVFENEPLASDSRFWKLDNIVITPHISGPSITYLDKVYPIVKHNLQAYLADQISDMRNVYSHERGY